MIKFLQSILFLSVVGLALGDADWAIVHFNVGPAPVRGYLYIYQAAPGDPAVLFGVVDGLRKNAKHGFHVHEGGDITDGCQSVGSHFNPRNLTHGGQTDEERHGGDLGNVETDENGMAVIYLYDYQIGLSGENSIIGRSFVVHEKEDDLGRGGDEGSKTTGNAGARLKCGIVGRYIVKS